MTISSAARGQVRHKCRFCCAYCGVSEVDVGGELEIEHFQPKIRGGTDDLGNLLYVCTTCNRFKGSYWPAANAPIDLHLLHPGVDTIAEHILELPDGQLLGITQRGWFHIQWLHLNRPQLVRLRQERVQSRLQSELLEETQIANRHLRRRVTELEAEVLRLRTLIRQFIPE